MRAVTVASSSPGAIVNGKSARALAGASLASSERYSNEVVVPGETIGTAFVGGPCASRPGLPIAAGRVDGLAWTVKRPDGPMRNVECTPSPKRSGAPAMPSGPRTGDVVVSNALDSSTVAPAGPRPLTTEWCALSAVQARARRNARRRPGYELATSANGGWKASRPRASFVAPLPSSAV
jgi:hypothetical protein